MRTMTADKPAIEKEVERAQARRKQLSVLRPDGHANRQWALCLSGGGIRSATFCLGVLQGLARAAPPPSPTDAAPNVDQARTLLPQFDYLSTVSGGGYAGSFFSSLFVTGRLSGNKKELPEVAARRAYEALAEEPPERMHSRTVYEPSRPGRAALAWLRDNGRYLAPTGSGDMVYAAGIGIRNWFATHYVLATLSLLVLAISLCVRIFASTIDGYDSIEAFLRQPHGVWWSVAWVLVALVLLVGVLPAGVGFWFTHPSKGNTVGGPSKIVTRASIVATLGGIGACSIGSWGMDARPDAVWPQVSIVIGAAILAGVACLALTGLLLRPASISQHRVVMTRLLSRSLVLTAMLAALATVETIAQTVAMRFDAPGRSIVSLSSLAAVLVWLIRFVAQRMGEKSTGGFLKQLPWHVLAGVIAVLLWLMLAVLFDLLLLWIVSDGRPSTLFAHVETSRSQLFVAGGTVLFLLAFAWSTGRFPGFLNLSTFQGLYSARLTRAYLGASNFTRFEHANSKWHSVAEPAPGDNLKVDELYANPLAPVHYINVCVNQNVDPSAQLVQRDRKGKPFVLAPPRGFYLDGEPSAIPNGGSGELASELTVGEWIGVSGAAFTTGLGRSTTLGGSLLLGFANVRLGRWWYSGKKAREGWLRRTFGTQLYLLDELRALFHGTRLPYQYLSDGGHFENTAAYEMVRPGRDIALLVICDCGADPDYEFGDLANLIRLARIDYGVEIVVNRQAAQHGLLKRCFGVPEDFKRTADGKVSSDRCAVLLDVFAPTTLGERLGERSLAARIILIKPAIVSGVAVDVQNYVAQHPVFPQEPTSDQFFNEAQWESYRKLGLHLACKLFPQRCHDDGYAQAFWETVLVVRDNVDAREAAAATPNVRC